MKQIFSLVLLALSALLACCTQDELPGGSVIPPGYSLYVSSTVIGSGSHSETEVSTRAGSVLVPVTKGSLGIFRSKGAGYSGELNNIEYTYTGAAKGWQPTAPTDTILLNGGDADVCAYYPYDGAMNFIDKTRMPIYSGKYTGNYSAVAGSFVYDLCYDINRTLNGSKRATTFEMKHAMAMLEFKITKDADYQGDCRVTSVSILNPNLITESSIDISSGTYATTFSKGTVAYNPGADADGILIGSIATTTSALLVPFTPDADGITLSFAVNDMPVEATIGTDKLPKVEAGNRYTVKLTMKATSMQVTGVDMLPWEETGVGGDDFTWYPTEDALKLTAPIRIGSYDWAWSNLEKDAAGYTLGSFQQLPGSLWPWNVLEPMAPPVKGGDRPSPNTTGVYQYAQDPCSQLAPAGTWVLPSKHQIDLLLSTDHVNTPTGCWFGTSTVPGKDDGTYLFLPANNLLSYHGYVSNEWLTALNEGVSGYWLDYNDPAPLNMLTVGGHEHLGLTDLPAVGIPFPGPAPIYAASIRCVQKERKTITIDGVEWAMGNLVKKSDGTYVIDDYQAALPPLFGSGGLWTEVTSGYHFTWNSLDRNSIGDYPAYDYDPDNDPCAKASPAGTWRTPTKEEFEKAMAKGQVKGDYTLNGKTVTGFYLGTNTAPPAKGGGDEYLFLPLAGGGDQHSFYDFYAQYLTGTEKEGSEGGNEAYSFNASKYGDTGAMELRNKSFPMAVRCVKGSLEKVYTLTKTEEVKIGTVTYARTNLNYDFTFEAEPWISGTMNGTNIDYWFWGRRDINVDGTYTNSSNDWNALTGEQEDPCKSVAGGGWILPTQAQLNALAKKVMPAGEKVSINGETLTVTGSCGWVANATKSTAGTVFYDSATKNVLFIPAAGTEDTAGNVQGTGSRGIIHVSDGVNATTTAPLYMSSGVIGIGYPGWSYRYTGNSIRCVKK